MRQFVTIKDTRYQLFPVEEWTFDEAAEFQRVSGLPVGRVMEHIADMDVNAYRGWFLVCMQRANPSASERDMVGLNFLDVIGSIERVEEEQEPPPDPQIASPSESGGKDDATSALPPTPEASGTPVGSTSE